MRSSRPSLLASSRIVVARYGRGCTQVRPAGAGESTDKPGRVLPAQLGQFGDQPIDTQTALVILVDLLITSVDSVFSFSRSDWFRFSQA